MTAGRPARVALLVIHATSALLLSVPLIIGLARGGFDWRFFDFAVAGVAVRAAPSAWFLLLGLRVLGRITPGLIRALRWTHGFALAFGAILAIIGLLTVYGDTHSGRSASGLSAAIDMIVVLVGAGIGGVALIALWLVRIVKTTMQSSGTP